MRLFATWQGMALCSAFFAALTAIFGKVGVSGLNSDLATFIRTLVIVPVVALLVTARGEWQMPASASGKAITCLVLSAIATGFSWVCYYRALQLGPASSVAPVEKLSVALTMVLAFAVLGEPVTAKALLGGALVVAGVIVISLR
jgi:transporter family protein